jgi:hypothetical protein
MRRLEEIFNASRNKVRRRIAVGNMLNSTGREIYIETIRTTTPRVMFALIRRSSRNAGSGVIIAMTIARTTSGTATSEIETFGATPAGIPFGLAVNARCLAATGGLAEEADFAAGVVTGEGLIDGYKRNRSSRQLSIH